MKIHLKTIAGVCVGLLLIVSPAMASETAILFTKALSHKDRPAEDKQRDSNRKAAQVLQLLDIKPGIKIVDYLAGRGYYTELFARVLNGDGHLYSVRGRLAKRQLGDFDNITVLQDITLAELDQRVDRIFTALNYHDLINRKQVDRQKVLKKMYDSLNAGGYVMVIDHNTAPGVGASETKSKHRVENTFVLNEFLKAGFVLDASPTLLANPSDNFDLDVWQESTKGQTDRFIYRFRKSL